MKRKASLALLITLSLAITSSVHAVAVTPTYTTFGSMPAATFGGSGIPNNAVAVTTVQATPNTSVTMGLTAFGRYSNPPLANNGAGTFTAGAGANYGDPTFATTPSTVLGSTWNFGWDIDVIGGNFNDYQFTLLYDFDPAAGADTASMGRINLNNPFASAADSQNLLFSFLDNSTPNGALALGVGLTGLYGLSFNPNISGEYGFALIMQDLAGAELGRSAIQVNVVGESVPEAGSSAALMAFGLIGLVIAGNKLKPVRASVTV